LVRIAGRNAQTRFLNGSPLHYIKELHPEIWTVICKIKASTKAFNTGIAVSDVEKNNDKILKMKLKEFRLPTGSI
jgi:hypothetical protein